MSKIQKALDAIRKTPAAERRDRDQLDGLRRPVHNDEASGEAELPLLTNELIAPRHAIEVDLARLAAEGLYPHRRDADLIARQFRRAKRPVIQCAFEDPTLAGENPNIIMMASALPGAGKTFCSFSLANSIAIERDFDSLLVDADMLKPGLSSALGLQDYLGLTDYLLDPSIEIADILVATDVNDIIVVPAGRKHRDATELLASKRMREFISTLSAAFATRAVIFDTPPLLLTNEAQVLAEKVGQIVFVIEARVSSQDSVMRALSLLDRNKPINAILNKSRSAASSGYKSDDYGYYPYITRNTADEP